MPEAGGIPEHYEERKIAIIGSNEMTSQIKVVEPRLVNNINGTNTLTFKLYYVYTDYETGKKVSNPFIKLLNNSIIFISSKIHSRRSPLLQRMCSLAY